MKRLASFGIVVGLAAMLLAAVPWAAVRSSGLPPPDQNTSTEPLAIIVNRSNPVDGLSMAELRRVFLGERRHWANDRRITLVMREPGEPERKIMLRDVYQMNEDQLKNHFIHGLFTGDILVSPKILASPTGVRKFVFNVPGAIGYVRASELDDTVKVLRIDELLPEDKGYRLRVEVRVAK